MSLPSRAQSDLEDRANEVLDILQLVLATEVCDEVHNILTAKIKDAMSEANLDGDDGEFLDEATEMLIKILQKEDKK